MSHECSGHHCKVLDTVWPGVHFMLYWRAGLIWRRKIRLLGEMIQLKRCWHPSSMVRVQSQGPTWWEKRTDSIKLSSVHWTHIPHTQISVIQTFKDAKKISNLAPFLGSQKLGWKKEPWHWPNGNETGKACVFAPLHLPSSTALSWQSRADTRDNQKQLKREMTFTGAYDVPALPLPHFSPNFHCPLMTLLKTWSTGESPARLCSWMPNTQNTFVK